MGNVTGEDTPGLGPPGCFGNQPRSTAPLPTGVPRAGRQAPQSLLLPRCVPQAATEPGVNWGSGSAGLGAFFLVSC